MSLDPSGPRGLPIVPQIVPQRDPIVPQIVPQTMPGDARIVPLKSDITGPRRKAGARSDVAPRPTGDGHEEPRDREKQPAKRVRRDPYRGVFILRPSGKKSPYYRLRFTDPETGKQTKERIPDHRARTVDSREAYRAEKWRELQQRKLEMRPEAGGPGRWEKANTPISIAIKVYFEKEGRLLADETRESYQRSCNHFIEWAKQENVQTVRELTTERLADLRLYIASLPLLKRRLGGKRGEMEESTEPRAKRTQNKDLAQIGTVLNNLRSRKYIRLSSDDISDGLKPFDAPVRKKPFLPPKKLAAVMLACVKHDCARFQWTRAQNKAGRKAPYRPQPRYQPVLPVVLFLLLSGMRLEEALLVEWGHLDEELDHISLPPEITKTGHFRDITFRVTPMLRQLLSSCGERTGRILATWTEGKVITAWNRLIEEFGAPDFDRHTLRRCCGTYLTCAPAIYGAAAPHMSAARLGHSLDIAQKHYVGVIEIPSNVTTLEGAMKLEEGLAAAFAEVQKTDPTISSEIPLL